MTKKIFIIMCMLTFNYSLASTVAVIDSGVDVRHADLAPFIWINDLEFNGRSNRDEDGNGYQDDIYGWNFAENNNQVIDYKYLGTFSNDVYIFFDYQQRYLLGTATNEEIQWMRDKVREPEFLKEIQMFGNFIHGTHVSGIVLNQSVGTKVLAVKLIPTKVGLSVAEKNIRGKKGGIDTVRKTLDALARTQMTTMTEISTYIASHGATVANGSFGTGYEQSKMITQIIFKAIMWRSPSEEELKDVTISFLNSLINHGQGMVAEASDTLFVFAAGNDGTCNDEFPTSPASLNAINTMSVAATFGREEIAVFSNYGIKTVDVAAPGVGINSTIPGDEWMKFSGTSQAAPYVAKIAGQIETINPALKPNDVKKIIMMTVDKKDFLKGLVKTSGIVNFDRAVMAAELVKNMSMEEAINESKVRVADVVSESIGKSKNYKDYYNFVQPLPSGFSF